MSSKSKVNLRTKDAREIIKFLEIFCEDHQRAQQHKLPKFEKLRMAIQRLGITSIKMLYRDNSQKHVIVMLQRTELEKRDGLICIILFSS